MLPRVHGDNLARVREDPICGGAAMPMGLEAGRAAGQASDMIQRRPFRYFRTSPEIIRLAVMLYARFPLSLRNGLPGPDGERLAHVPGLPLVPSGAAPSRPGKRHGQGKPRQVRIGLTAPFPAVCRCASLES